MTLSNSQITKLGERLRDSHLSADDLALLDAFRETFSEVDDKAYKLIQNTLQKSAECTITKRKRKTQQSIVDKLHRQPRLRLPQMQDIAGCRIVIQGGIEQAQNINAMLVGAFEQAQWYVESKIRHTVGYRAIHIIARSDNMAHKKFYEIQLRTYAQDIWANLVESLCDKNNTLKYGGTEQEQVLMNTLKTLADTFYRLDQQAHQVGFADYALKLQEAIQNVLSH